MFFHELNYAMKTMLKNKTALIWTLLFPMILGTFMYMAFGSLWAEELFEVIPVAVVKKQENHALELMLEKLSEQGENQLLEISYLSEEEAQKALQEEEVASILYVEEELRLLISNNSYESTILKSIIEEYKKQEKIWMDIIISSNGNLEEVMESFTSEQAFFVKKITSNGNQDFSITFFYAIFAMSCLFASFSSIEKIGRLQANVSALGKRRSIAPNSKFITIIAEFLSMLLCQFLIEVITLLYFILLGIDFGNKYVPILGILLCGSCIGIAIGIIIGSFSKLSENMKSGICILVSMVLSVLADLVAIGVRSTIEHTIPIFNRINPAALIVDSFYALNIYDTYDRYMRNMTTLVGMTGVLLLISFCILRRKEYASV